MSYWVFHPTVQKGVGEKLEASPRETCPGIESPAISGRCLFNEKETAVEKARCPPRWTWSVPSKVATFDRALVCATYERGGGSAPAFAAALSLPSPNIRPIPRKVAELTEKLAETPVSAGSKTALRSP